MISARSIYKDLGYKQWRCFEGLIKRAINLIKNGIEKGIIKETKKETLIGSGAKRKVKDYLFNNDAFNLIERLSNGYKLNNCYSIRNETVLLGLLKKYCKKKGIKVNFQYSFGTFLYDCCLNHKIFIEFDEPHHKNKKQKNIDNRKDKYVKSQGYKILRFNLDNDIVDLILEVEKNI